MSSMAASGDERRRNKRWPEAPKREIVAAACRPVASVSVVARGHDIDANEVFAWRRRFLAEAKSSTPALVPVTITPEPDDEAAPAAPAASEAIEIEVGGDCRARVGSGFDGRALKRVLDVLRKR